jgi:hypothetical protein
LDRVVCVQGRVERRPDVERTTEANEELPGPSALDHHQVLDSGALDHV